MSSTGLIEHANENTEADDYELVRISAEIDPQSLVAELAECMSITVKAIVKIGAIIRRLEILEFDIGALKLPNLNYFRRVAHGKMIPELFVSLVGAPIVLRKVSYLPIPDQQRIASGKPVKVILRGGDHMLIRVDDLTNEQARQVFASDHIRSDSQQAAWLVERSQKVTSVASASVVMIDRKRHGIVVGDTFISATDLAGYLGSLAEK